MTEKLPYKLHHRLLVPEDQVRLAIAERSEKNHAGETVWINELWLYIRPGQGVKLLQHFAETIMLRRFAEEKYGSDDGKSRIIFYVSDPTQLEDYRRSLCQ
jgi:hypothetical protein